MNNDNVIPTITQQESDESQGINNTIILSIISLFSCGMFILTGWAFLFAIPASLVFSILYSLIFSNYFRKSRVGIFSGFTVSFTLVFAYISILLNMGVVSDAEYITYLIPNSLGIPSSSFNEIFSYLLNISFIYLLISTLINILLIRKNANRIIFGLIPLSGLLLVIFHTAFIWNKLPELKTQVIQTQKEMEQKKQNEIEKEYAFDWSKITEKTFKNRIYSIFTPPTPSTVTEGDCSYIMNMIGQNLIEGGFNINCLNNAFKSTGKMPITKTGGFIASIPNTLNTFKKGDVVAIVVELEKNSMVRIHADGNAAKDCGCRMNPFDYSGINDHVKIGNSIVYEQSVVQMAVVDKTRTIMLFYPININGLKDINIKISQFSENPNTRVTLKEVSLLSPTQSSADPNWLRDWLSQPNYFLK